MSFPGPTEKQARTLWVSVTALSVGILVALLGLIVWALGYVVNLLAPVLLPLAVAGIVAYLLDPVVDFFERKNVPRGWAIILVFFLCLVVFLGLLGSVIPSIVRQTRELIHEWPNYKQDIRERVERWATNPPWPFSGDPDSDAGPVAQDGDAEPPVDDAQAELADRDEPRAPAMDGAGNANAPPLGPVPSGRTLGEMAREKLLDLDIGETVMKWFGSIAPAIWEWVRGRLSRVASLVGMLVGMALAPVFTFYFLYEKRSIRAGWTDYLPVQESWFKEELVFVLNAINSYLIVFFRGQVLVALCIGVLLSIGFLAIGLDYALLLGAAAGALSIVPYLGAIMTIVPAVILSIVQSSNWVQPILVVIVFAIVQMLEGLVISPKIMGDRVGLHPLTIIIAVMVGTILMGGILGGILAIPLTAALRVLMFRYIWRQPAPAPEI